MEKGLEFIWWFWLLLHRIKSTLLRYYQGIFSSSVDSAAIGKFHHRHQVVHSTNVTTSKAESSQKEVKECSYLDNNRTLHDQSMFSNNLPTIQTNPSATTTTTTTTTCKSSLLFPEADIEGERRRWVGADEFRRKYIDKSRPVCVTDYVAKWPAIRKWSLEYLIKMGKEVHVEVAMTTNEEQERQRGEGGDIGIIYKRSTTLAGYLQQLAREKGEEEEEGKEITAAQKLRNIGYLKQLDVHKLPFSLQSDVGGAAGGGGGGGIESNTSTASSSIFGSAGRFGSRYLWIGPKGSMTGLHNDDEDNVLCQIKGTKIVKLFPPHTRPYLYPNDKYDSGTECCDYDAFTDWKNTERHREMFQQKFILARKAGAALRFKLQEGDMLFIPKFWYHQVFTASAYSISVNQFSSTTTEFISCGIQREILSMLHQLGLYGTKSCVCHGSKQKNTKAATALSM